MPHACLRFGQILLLVALFSATGFQWLALQTVAWGAMLVDYTRHVEWSEAVKKTFDGKHPCELCKSIEQGKKAEKKGDVTVIVTKLDLFHQPIAALVVREVESWEFRAGNRVGELRFEQPPLQPPRVA